MYYFEASAKSGLGVKEAFDFIASKVFSSLLLDPNFLARSKHSFLLERMENQDELRKKSRAKCCK